MLNLPASKSCRIINCRCRIQVPWCFRLENPDFDYEIRLLISKSTDCGFSIVSSKMNFCSSRFVFGFRVYGKFENPDSKVEISISQSFESTLRLLQEPFSCALYVLSTFTTLSPLHRCSLSKSIPPNVQENIDAIIPCVCSRLHSPLRPHAVFWRGMSDVPQFRELTLALVYRYFVTRARFLKARLG